MAVLNRSDLREHVRRNEFAPVYTLFGPEVHLRKSAELTIADRQFSAEDFRDFNDSTYSLNNDGALDEALSTARQLPMMSARRVVRIVDVRISASGYRDTLTDKHEELLTSYLESPSPHATVIIVANELNGVRRIGKLLRERTATVNFEPLTERELPEWVRRSCKEADVTIEDAAVNLFLSRIGPDLEHLKNEIEKLATAALPDKIITAELVDALVPDTREIGNFEFTDLLIAGRKHEALAVLRKTLDDGAEPVVLLGSISYTYRSLLTAKDLMSRGAEPRKLQSSVRIQPAKQSAFFAAARRADLSKLTGAIQDIAEADLAIKTSKGGSGPAGARMQIEVLACKLAMI